MACHIPRPQSLEGVLRMQSLAGILVSNSVWGRWGCQEALEDMAVVEGDWSIVPGQEDLVYYIAVSRFSIVNLTTYLFLKLIVEVEV